LRPIWMSQISSEPLSTIETTLLDHSLAPEQAPKYHLLACWNPSMYKMLTSPKGQFQWMEELPNVQTNVPSNVISIASSTQKSSHGYYYTPGAADDQESWDRHLTPALFWQHYRKILDPALTEDETDACIDVLVQQCRESQELHNQPRPELCDEENANQIGTLPLWVGSRRAGRPPTCWQQYDAILNVTEQEYPEMTNSIVEAGQSTNRFYLQLAVAEGKRDKTELERWMPVGLAFLIHHLRQNRRVLGSLCPRQGPLRGHGFGVGCVGLSPLGISLASSGPFRPMEYQ